MEDSFGKYLRLFGTLFFVFLGFLVSLALLMLGIKFFFGMLNYIPWFTYLYMSFIIMFPAAIFVTAYIIFFRRTKNHPSRPIRMISRAIFVMALLAWAYFFISDLVIFFRHFYTTIERYNTYNLLFLSINIGCIFFVGVMQALTTEKEKDWMDRTPAK
jgi:hypothetical protein